VQLPVWYTLPQVEIESKKQKREKHGKLPISSLFAENPQPHIAGYSVVNSLSAAPAFATAIASALRSGSTDDDSTRMPRMSAKAAAMQGQLSLL
jgi:hypothetical protein